MTAILGYVIAAALVTAPVFFAGVGGWANSMDPKLMTDNELKAYQD